jgi:2-C-methyl-D-erythritol 4-phosphate cytidylyltransferase
LQESADAVIVAAGSGIRYAAESGIRHKKRKQLLEFAGTTVVGFIADVFSRIEEVKNVIVVYPQDMDAEDFRARAKLKKDVIITSGGSKRAESVKSGLRKVSSEYVLIHDGVRPGISKKLVKRVIEAVKKHGSAVPAIKPVSTVRYMKGKSLKTLKREDDYLIQTPQGFIAKELLEAYNNYGDLSFTDSSSLMEAAGLRVKIIKGEKYNIKITSPEDYRYIREVIKR